MNNLNGLIIFLGAVLGVIIFLTILVLIIKNKIKNVLNKFGYINFNQLKDEIKRGEVAYNTEPKHVTGMTKLLIPKIIKDFPNFSENELYKVISERGNNDFIIYAVLMFINMQLELLILNLKNYYRLISNFQKLFLCPWKKD